MKGYQFLENDFFGLCKTREIGRVPMLLFIYLRGLYHRSQKLKQLHKPKYTFGGKRFISPKGHPYRLFRPRKVS